MSCVTNTRFDRAKHEKKRLDRLSVARVAGVTVHKSVDNPGLSVGAEIVIATRRPYRLAGRRGTVIELDLMTEKARIALGHGESVWIRTVDAIPAYGEAEAL